MKILIGCSIFCLISAITFAQRLQNSSFSNDNNLKSEVFNDLSVADNYAPFLNNSTWYSVMQGFEGYINYVYITEKDTTFNGFSYSKIKLKFVKLQEVWNDKGFWGGGSVIFVREDNPNKRVFQYFKGTGDVLLYDFGLELGDLLPQDPKCLLVNIDSIEGADGSKKRFTFKENDDRIIIWIEGVGNISDPFQSDAIMWDARKLICASQNGVNTYSFTNKDGITCDSFDKVLASSGEKENSLRSVYPNPTNGLFRINFDGNASSGRTVRILDLNGKTVLDVGKCLWGNSVDVNISIVPSGLYCGIIDSDGKTECFKIIKQ